MKTLSMMTIMVMMTIVVLRMLLSAGSLRIGLWLTDFSIHWTSSLPNDDIWLLSELQFPSLY